MLSSHCINQNVLNTYLVAIWRFMECSTSSSTVHTDESLFSSLCPCALFYPMAAWGVMVVGGASWVLKEVLLRRKMIPKSTFPFHTLMYSGRCARWLTFERIVIVSSVCRSVVTVTDRLLTDHSSVHSYYSERSCSAESLWQRNREMVWFEVWFIFRTFPKSVKGRILHIYLGYQWNNGILFKCCIIYFIVH